MSRTWPVPIPERTIHCIGDTHFGANVTAVAKMENARAPKILNDFDSPLIPKPVAHFFLGDMVNDGTAAQDNMFLSWTAQFPKPVYLVLGGHETWLNIRTPTQAASALGMTGVNFSVNLGFARFLSLGFDAADNVGSMLRLATGAGGCLDWLANQLLSDTVTPTFIGCHNPLYNTVGRTAGSDEYRSIDPGFYGERDNELRNIIGAVPNVKAFITGHTHSPLQTSELVTKETIGYSTLVCANCSSTSYQYSANVPQIPNSRLESLYLTWLDKPDRMQIRFRSHGSKQWTTGGPNGMRMIEVIL